MGRRDTRGRVTATEAAKNFGTLVDRVREERAFYVVERGGQEVAEIGPVSTKRCTVADLSRLLKELGPVDDEFARDVRDGVAAFNLPEPSRRR
jgi:hypothetical protein